MSEPEPSKAARKALNKLTRTELEALRVHLRRLERLEPAAPRPPRHREVSELAGAARRMLRAVADRVGTAGNPEDLEELVKLRAHVDDELGRAVRALKADGFAWEDVARVLGVTRQAAYQRWGRQRGTG